MREELQTLNGKLDKIIILLENQAVKTSGVKILASKKNAAEKKTEGHSSVSE